MLRHGRGVLLLFQVGDDFWIVAITHPEGPPADLHAESTPAVAFEQQVESLLLPGGSLDPCL